MYALYDPGSGERAALNVAYQNVIQAYGNSRSALFKSSFATALRQVLGKANSNGIQFWIILVNPTAMKTSITVYVRLSDVGHQASTTHFDAASVNCPLDSASCPVFTNPAASGNTNLDYQTILQDLGNGGDLVSQVTVDLGPEETAARGISVANSFANHPKGIYSVALVGEEAKDRVVFDEHDVLRVGAVKLDDPP